MHLIQVQFLSCNPLLQVGPLSFYFPCSINTTKSPQKLLKSTSIFPEQILSMHPLIFVELSMSWGQQPSLNSQLLIINILATLVCAPVGIPKKCQPLLWMLVLVCTWVSQWHLKGISVYYCVYFCILVYFSSLVCASVY